MTSIEELLDKYIDARDSAHRSGDLVEETLFAEIVRDLEWLMK